MNNPGFHGRSWKDYLYWQTQDRKTLKKINDLIEDIQRSPYEGLGHPEPLKHKLAGYWSREIDTFNRLVYTIEGDDIIIIQCKDHYND